MSNTKIINLLGASGSGKSTTSLGLTYELKKLGCTDDDKNHLLNGGNKNGIKH